LTLSIQEKSNYFRGMLILMKMDRRIDNAEKDLLIKIGKTLGFEKNFCLTAIKELLDNEFISEDIPIFSNEEYAKCFIQDGLRLAVSDNELNPNELNYLKKTLLLNNLEENWFKEKIKNLLISDDYNNQEAELFIEQFLESENVLDN
jgi:hypothetical protein